MRIVIVMPTYNEAANMERMLPRLFDRVFPRTAAEMHLLVVDDRSPDGTGEVVIRARERYPHLHLLSGPRRGLGWAYVRGMRHAMDDLEADAVLEMDADFQHAPEDVPVLVDALHRGADYVIGSRFIPGSAIAGPWPRHRRLLSLGGNRLARRVLRLERIHDLTTGFRLTRVRGVLDAIDLEHLMALERFAFKVDLLYRTVRLAVRTVEVPITFGVRCFSATKFRPREIGATLSVLLRLRIGTRW